MALSVVLLGGCGRLRHEHHDTVWVAVRATFLHDRVAAVSNRVAQVSNGDALEVLERGRRFLRVKTQKNEIGWIEQHAVIDAATHDAFAKIGETHKQDPTVATAVIRDDIYLHVRAGRETDKFYLLPANAKVQLLARASVVKGQAGTAPRLAAVVVKPAAKPDGAAAPAEAPAPPPMEDWWLVRDAQGRAGWLLGSRVDVDVPDEIGIYAEGQRIVGAYILAKVTDPDAPTPNHVVPEYLTVLSPPKSGLPCDFDQVRVFTWSLKRHRYETAYRLHPIQGYLPVTLGQQPGPNGPQPTFGFQIANGTAVLTDPAMGVTRPASPRNLRFALNDTQVRRIGPDLAPLSLTHSPDDEKKKDAKGKGKKK